MHVVPAAEEAALDPGDEQAQEAVAPRAEASDAQDEFLDRDAGKDGLIDGVLVGVKVFVGVLVGV